ncbi:MAG: flagellin [Candidatus Latescibacterota bacterium]|jgi:flagellin|tara:strand:+ start:318 stop:1145 length:828 start_codon:yes stop_codon:yes gene_type:complete
MPARINHNAHLMQMHRNLGVHFENANRQIEQISSGNRVNRSSDDAANLALADGIDSELRALQEGGRNMQQSIQMLQVTEGALGQISNIMQRLQELAVQSSSSTYNDSNRPGANAEFQSLKNEINRIAEFTSYNGISILSSDKEFAIQAGPSETSNDVSRISIGDMRSTGPRLNLDSTSIDTLPGAQQTIDRLQEGQQKVLGERNRIAAFQNRLQLSAETTASIVERMKGVESNIRGADVARAISNLTRSQILSQTATSIAQEADTDISRILSLLQ